MNFAGNRGVPVLEGFGDIARGYDLILCDVWGVLHDGTRAHAAAGDALRRFRTLPGERPRRVRLVSNAPRRWRGVQAILDGFGVSRDAYDDILTSGDLTHDLLAARGHTRVHHLGPARDLSIFDGLDTELVAAGEAEIVVCTGLFDDDTETAEDYRAILSDFAERRLPMICANPDLVVEKGGRLIPCAGAVAALYAEMNGAVTYAGKPHRPIYDAALRRTRQGGKAAPVRADRVIAIGDAIRTDIAGARSAGIASLLVARGIHAEELGLTLDHHRLSDVAAWLARQDVRPDAVIERLVW